MKSLHGKVAVVTGAGAGIRRELALELARHGPRQTKAAKLLLTDCSVEEVARYLGCAETASFTHAFTRWRAMSPRAYRQTVLGEPGPESPA